MAIHNIRDEAEHSIWYSMWTPSVGNELAVALSLGRLGEGDEGEGWECVGFCGGFKKNVMSTWRTCTLQSAVQLTSVEHHISLIILLIYKNRPRTCVCVWVEGGE